MPDAIQGPDDWKPNVVVGAVETVGAAVNVGAGVGADDGIGVVVGAAETVGAGETVGTGVGGTRPPPHAQHISFEEKS